MWMLLCFLGRRGGVEGPGEIICQVNTNKFGALDNLHSCVLHLLWELDSMGLPEINNHFFHLVHVQKQIVAYAPSC